ncbi:MAG: GNAT family N-acetyltransferase [Pseudomonadota bacterium]
MSDTPTITYSETETKGRYAAKIDGSDEEAELTTSIASPTLVIADHTYVPDAFRGKGIAEALVKQLIADAREKGQKILPLCPFVKAYAARHRKELADVMQG